jgi:hypothetical protein
MERGMKSMVDHADKKPQLYAAGHRNKALAERREVVMKAARSIAAFVRGVLLGFQFVGPDDPNATQPGFQSSSIMASMSLVSAGDKFPSLLAVGTKMAQSSGSVRTDAAVTTTAALLKALDDVLARGFTVSAELEEPIAVVRTFTGAAVTNDHPINPAMPLGATAAGTGAAAVVTATTLAASEIGSVGIKAYKLAVPIYLYVCWLISLAVMPLTYMAYPATRLRANYFARGVAAKASMVGWMMVVAMQLMSSPASYELAMIVRSPVHITTCVSLVPWGSHFGIPQVCPSTRSLDAGVIRPWAAVVLSSANSVAMVPTLVAATVGRLATVVVPPPSDATRTSIQMLPLGTLGLRAFEKREVGIVAISNGYLVEMMGPTLRLAVNAVIDIVPARIATSKAPANGTIEAL